MSWPTRSRGGVPRTGATSLSDQELVVCDALVLAPCGQDLLLSGAFHSIFNLPYGGIATLDPVILERMYDKKIVGDIELGESRPIGLSLSGGQMWEAERRPNWMAFCRSAWRRERGVGILRVEARSRELAEEYLRVSVEVGMHVVDLSQPPKEAATESHLPYWKPASKLTLELPKSSYGRPDWNAYEARRRWWRTVPELLRSYGELDPLPGWPLPPALESGEA